ncbi:TetR/AcrR family transcriptional regulator [Deinococcus cellulosilyticus]|uniref:Putative transcriptional regulator, TetR family protein n=1 Tax=Deinococcus cellulosilyticus (strain DSM 18568 / NBRC 106333 / KACC 11606 / 5516J-15) TaxID=1223518 RepID=A0A511N242_DEIC1|nr:TetR/AcrR family transcriptional regulator [Deinococcus cellulosilyticus]GEM46924.1 putative transcriptional regulator, TetR family protein [Deinococcus cellulosilyticus NBRC 106333 = KACC 11606]
MSIGRPRNNAHSDAAKEAALQLLTEHGYAAISMEAVAQHTGIAKQTLYRRWKNKRDLILDAFVDDANRMPPAADTGSLEEDLRLYLRQTATLLNSNCGVTNRALMAEGLQDSDFLKELRERHLIKRRTRLRDIIRRKHTHFTEEQETFLVDLALGPVWYRLLVQNAPLNDAFTDALAHQVTRAARELETQTS